ncbi:uncharacterized protein H6S33_012977 [Morchella sextelata]|uniref:uncharacterized protein n=1 Tax=Morchella sextelata TaxID=1174677 RepID=UPI001D04494C|nr:uncharacterized protein H6S33_012977 [Morchella sextelata]KAH0609491.1 hypothetical protein H6S33_012977 [Morchella sextelata]
MEKPTYKSNARELQQALRLTDDKILDVRKNVIRLYQYIKEVLAPPGTDPAVYVEWDAHTMIKSFNKINEYSTFDEDDSIRFRFAVGFAQGGLQAQGKRFPKLTAELHARLNDWGTLRSELGRMGDDTPNSIKAQSTEIFEFTEEMIFSWRELREVIHIPGFDKGHQVSSRPAAARLARTQRVV